MEKIIISILTISSIFFSSIPCQAQNITKKENSERITSVSGNFTILIPAFLEHYARKLCGTLEKEHEHIKFQIISSREPETFSIFENGEGDLALGLNPFPEKSTDKEIEVLRNPSGRDILSIGIGKVGIMILINASNPLNGLNLPQADAIFSSTRRCGYPFDITKWGQLGLSGPWSEQPLHLTGLTRKDFFTYGLFQQMALCAGTLKPGFQEQIDAADIVSRVSKDKRAIGFSSLVHERGQTRAVPLAAREGSEYFSPTDRNILSGDYPLSRTVFIFVRKIGSRSLPQWQRLFIKRALDENGQKMLANYGIVPLYPNSPKKDVIRHIFNGMKHVKEKDKTK